jgi:hypothetical protein
MVVRVCAMTICTVPADVLEFGPDTQSGPRPLKASSEKVSLVTPSNLIRSATSVRRAAIHEPLAAA